MTEDGSAASSTGFDARSFVRFASRIGHGAALGFTYVAHGDDWAELVLPYAPALVGKEETGVMASGPIISLMDMATSTAVWLRRGRFQHQATLDMRVDYLRPAAPGRPVHGRGECYRITHDLAFVRGAAHDGDPDDPIAHVVATFMATGD